LARIDESFHEEGLIEKQPEDAFSQKLQDEKVKLEQATGAVQVQQVQNEEWKQICDEQVPPYVITDDQANKKVLTLSEKEFLGKESISKTKEGVKKEDNSDGTEKERMPLEEKQKKNEESEARRRWRGACRLALHTNPGALHTNPGTLHTNPGALHNNLSNISGAGALHTKHGSGTKKLSLPELHADSGKQKLDGPPRRISTGSCNLVMHTDKANNSDASELDFVDAGRADTNSSGPRACNFGMHTTLPEVNHSYSDPGKFSKITPTMEKGATVRKTSDPGPHSKITPTTENKTTVRKTSDPGPHSKITTLTTENATTMRKKWKNACKLVLHTNSLTTKKEKDEEEVFGMHTRPARLAPKIQVEEVDDEEADTLEEHEEEGGVETLSGNNGGGGKGRCRLTLHCGENDQEVTPGALLSISLKKQGQASKSRRLSDCLLHQVLITNLVHQAEEEVQRGIRESFCFPF